MQRFPRKFAALVTGGFISAFLSLASPLTSFAAIYTASNTNDSGAGSLRQAILDANANPGSDIINIAATGTITVNPINYFMVITESVKIFGPGPALLTISGGNASRIFWIQNGDVTIQDLTLANGFARGGTGGGGGMGAGGAIFMHEGKQGTNPTDVASGNISLTLFNVVLKDNVAQGGNGLGGFVTGGGGMGGNGHADGASGGVLGSAIGYQYGGSVTNATSSARGNNGGIPIFGSGGKEGSPSDAGFGGGGGGDEVGGFAGGGGGATVGGGSFGRGGFGGGGGNAGSDNNYLNNGGARGGYGGGGGGLAFVGNGSNGDAGQDNGQGGFGAGDGANLGVGLSAGGGGMGAGGAIFVGSGILKLQDVSFQNNTATGGTGGNPGKGLGGALFVFNKADNGNVAVPGTTTDPQVTKSCVTFSGNAAADDAGVAGNDDDVYGTVVDLPLLSVLNVQSNEGHAGTTIFSFKVSLCSPALAGGVTFDIATADGNAQDDNPVTEDDDYVAKSLTGQIILEGSSEYTFDVTVNGDLDVETDEAFFVNVTNVTGAGFADGTGNGIIANDDVSTTPIHVIQGSGTVSPLVAQTLTTIGIVTGVKSNGFFIQTPDDGTDGNPSTSEGIFVFTSSAPPAAATLGNLVRVTGLVLDVLVISDPSSPSVTELTSPTVDIISAGNPLPAPITLSSGNFTNSIHNLESFEGMRVQVNSLTVVAPTGGIIDEPNATSATNGVFYGVVNPIARPYREPGIQTPDVAPSGSPANIPVFDANPERLRVDSDGLGGTALEVTTGATVLNLVGPLDYVARAYTLLPDPSTPPDASGNISATAVPVPTADEFTVATLNLQRWFDTVDDPSVLDVVLSATAFSDRLNKASLAIRNVMRYPDVIGVQEAENLSTLQSLATRVNNDAVAATDPNPNYQAFLLEGNDAAGIDVGFLVKTSRVDVVDVTQFGSTDTYINPNTLAADVLNDRPPLVLRATITPPGGVPFAFTTIVSHLRSLTGVDDAFPEPIGTVGARVRAKRRAQAEFLANLIQARQTADPTERIISLGDYNAFQFNDGYVDVMGTVSGVPTPADQVVAASSDLVNPDLTNLTGQAAATQRYTFSFGGNAQALDHIVIAQNLVSIVNSVQYARVHADFPETYRNDASRPERVSDHDPVVAYFALPVTSPVTCTWGFEPPQNLAGWTPVGSCALSQVSPGHSGTYALQVLSTTSEESKFGIDDSPDCVDPTAEKGRFYQISAYVKGVNGADGYVTIQVREYVGSTQQGSTATSTKVRLSSSWKLVTFEYKVRADNSRLSVQILDSPDDGRETFLVDDISMTLLPDRPPIVKSPATVNAFVGFPVSFAATASDPDGHTITSFTHTGAPGSSFATNNSKTSGTFTWTPAGTGVFPVVFVATANALNGESTTEINVAPAPPNLCSNGTFEDGIAGWEKYGSARLTQVSPGHTGNDALQIRGTSSSSFGCDDVPNCVPPGAAKNAVYQFSAWVRSESHRGKVKIRIYEFKGSSQQGSTAYSDEISLSQTWRLLTVNYKVRTQGSTLSMRITDESGNQTFLVDDVTVFLISSPPIALRLSSDGDSGDEEAAGAGPRLVYSALIAPNPANRNGVLSFTLTRPGWVRAHLFDAAGRRVSTLIDAGVLEAGTHQVSLAASNHRRLATGLYFYRVESEEGVLGGRLVFVE